MQHETQVRGERHGRARLTADQVLAIRDLDGTMLQRDIARLFGIGQMTVSCIVRRVTWAHLEPRS